MTGALIYAVEAPEPCIPSAAKRMNKMFIAAGFKTRITLGVSGTERYGPDRGVCSVCEKTVIVKNSGTLRTHGPKAKSCKGTDTEPKAFVKGEKLPREESIVVRVKDFGAACWIDGSFEMGCYVSDCKTYYVVTYEWKPYNARVKEICQGQDGCLSV